MGVDNPSRRAVLGAAVGLSFDRGLSCAPLRVRQAQPLLRMSGEGVAEEAPPPGFTRSPSPSLLGEDWVRALAAFEAAAGEVRAFEALCSRRPFAEQEALQGGYDARGEAMGSALLRLLRAPAPDVAALAVKIGLAIDHEIGTLSGGAACLAAIRRDALRLSSGQAKRWPGR